jgi:hypothetical protein
MNPSPTLETPKASIDAKIAALDDWRGPMLAKLRKIIVGAAPGIVEEWKWATPVWSHHGILCTGETYKAVVKMTFARGAALADPKGLFNSSLGGGVRRAIDVHEGEKIDAAALKALVRAAVALNVAGTNMTKARKAVAKKAPATKAPTKKARQRS